MLPLLSLKEDYPRHWDKNVFNQLTTFKDKCAYCREHLDFIASGSAREVFRIDDTKVLKLAKNNKGLAQNETETDLFFDPSSSSLCNTVYDFDENCSWMEMAYAEKMTKSKFKKITGCDFNSDFVTALRHEFFYSQYFTLADSDNKEIYDTDFWEELVSFIINFDLPFYDFCRLSTYGIVDGEIKIIDYGLTKDIYNTMYDRNRKRA
jgi:hypothetical protein